MRVLLIGDAEREEMQAIVRWMKERTAQESWRHELRISGPLNVNGMWPDLVVVLESHPDEHSIDDFNSLFAAAPLCRIVCCAGAWSEAAGRTRKIWPLALRVPAVCAIERLEQEWQILEHSRPGGTPLRLSEGRGLMTLATPVEDSETCHPEASISEPRRDRIAWYLPPTGSREEWFAAHHPSLALETCRNGPTIRIHSPDVAYREMLSELASAAGHTVVPNQTDAIDFVLFDADPWDDARRDELRQFTVTASVIALTSWKLPVVAAELYEIGVQTVLPKLGDYNRLLEVLSAQVGNVQSPA